MYSENRLGERKGILVFLLNMQSPGVGKPQPHRSPPTLHPGPQRPNPTSAARPSQTGVYRLFQPFLLEEEEIPPG